MRIGDWSSDVCSSDLSGIGEATAHLLADNGFAVVVADLDATAALRVANAITHAGGRAVAHMTNVANPDDAQAAVACAEQPDRTSVVYGTGVSVRVDLGVSRIIRTNKD